MSSTTEALPRRLFPLPEPLAASPGGVVCLALLVNAVVQPYLGYFHDARLYAFYLQSRLEPALGFDRDLYLTYGSQDRYSLFSLVMFPLVKLVGLGAGFFLAYLASKALLFWGMTRLVRVLTRNDLVAAVTVVLLAASPIAFGGNDVFHVNESFLTPRLGAAALVLLALERMLAGKYVLPGVLLLGAMLLHPLIGVAGVLTFALWWALGHLNWRQLALLFVAAVAASVAVLAYEPLGTRLLGRMEDGWRATTLQICFFIRPGAWTAEDWVRLGFETAVLVGGACTVARHCWRFVAAVLGAGVIGLAWSAVGVETHYLLLIQTSPYRTLWVLGMAAVPVGMMAVADLWRRGTPWARGGSLALLLLLTHDIAFHELNALFFGLLTVAFITIVIWQRGLGRQPANADWQWPTVRYTFLSACGLLVLGAALILWYVFTAPPTPDVPRDPVNVPRLLGPVLSLLLWCVLACYAAAGLVAVLGNGRRWQLAACATTVLYLGAGTYLLEAPWYQRRYATEESHTAFIADFLERHRSADGPAPCVYWDTDIDRIWFRLRANSFVTVYQLAGCAFNRETAAEGKRRVHLVGRFEAEGDRHRERLRTGRWRGFWEDYRDCPFDAPPPTRADLLRLVREDRLDYAVLPVGFDDLDVAGDGQYFIYDCKQLRERLAKEAAPAAPTTVAATGR